MEKQLDCQFGASSGQAASSPKALRVCIFCNSSEYKLTKEHVVPKWLGSLYPGEETATAVLHSRSLDEKPYVYPIRIFEQKVLAPCARCNNGWMSDLEIAVRSQLGPMVRHHQPCNLSRTFQKPLATWAVKTAYLFQQLIKRQHVVPRSEYKRFYDIQQPLASHIVEVGYRSSLTDATGAERLVDSYSGPVTEFIAPNELREQYQAWLAAGYTMYRITIAIGHVVFRVRGHNFPAPIPTSENDILQRIWPIVGPKRWPNYVSILDLTAI